MNLANLLSNFTLDQSSTSCESGFNEPIQISAGFFTQEPISTITIGENVLETLMVDETSTTVASTYYVTAYITLAGATMIYAPTLQVQFNGNDTSIVSLLRVSAASASSASAALFNSSSTASSSIASSSEAYWLVNSIRVYQ
jgi:hypothetical protein